MDVVDALAGIGIVVVGLIVLVSWIDLFANMRGNDNDR